jgi:hypothetical protein
MPLRASVAGLRPCKSLPTPSLMTATADLAATLGIFPDAIEIIIRT